MLRFAFFWFFDFLIFVFFSKLNKSVDNGQMVRLHSIVFILRILFRRKFFFAFTVCVKRFDQFVVVIEFMMASRTFHRKAIFLNCHNVEFFKWSLVIKRNLNRFDCRFLKMFISNFLILFTYHKQVFWLSTAFLCVFNTEHVWVFCHLNYYLR